MDATSWRRMRQVVQLLALLLFVTPVGLSYHTSSHCHGPADEADCSSCILHAQHVGFVYSCLQVEAPAQGILATVEAPALVGRGAPFHHPVRGPPATSV